MLTYDDLARVKVDAPAHLRPGQRCSVIAVIPDAERRRFPSLELLPSGTVYFVEFEDGDALDVHERYLDPLGEPTQG